MPFTSTFARWVRRPSVEARMRFSRTFAAASPSAPAVPGFGVAGRSSGVGTGHPDECGGSLCRRFTRWCSTFKIQGLLVFQMFSFLIGETTLPLTSFVTLSELALCLSPDCCHL